MAARTTLCLIGLVILLLAAGCSNSKTTEPIPSSDTAVLSGKVVAAWCVPWIDPPDKDWMFPYTEETGLQATLEFFKHGGGQQSTATDMHSQYAITLDTGLYTIAVEYWHGWPTRFTNFHVGRDTTFDPLLFLQYQWPDTVMCRFLYMNAEDSLTEEEERAQLNELNVYNGSYGAYNAMAVESAVRIVNESSDPFLKAVDYHVNPRTGWYVWQIIDAGTATLATHKEHFASGLSVEASYIICFDFGKSAPHEMTTVDCGN